MEADIQGAINVGMDYIFFNSTNVISDLDLMCEIKSLIELKELL
ncbi:MAG: hypothetical protein LH629_12655 [Ignavibacteria bacterium]|nr:hypothetical protein [Ignavibacteria bacterium]